MDNIRLHVIFEGPEIAEHGVPLADMSKTLNRLQRAYRLMLSHQERATTAAGNVPAWIRRGSELRLTGTAPGSLTAELEATPLTDKRASGKDAAQRAIDDLTGWQTEKADALPTLVARELSLLWTKRSPEITGIALRNPLNGHRVEINHDKLPEWAAGDVSPKRANFMSAPPRPAVSASVPVTLHGKLMAVDWENRTARLQRYLDTPIPLRFGAALDREMQRVTRQRVEVIGQGRFDETDHWAEVQVEQIKGTLPQTESFDPEAFRDNPNFKPFDPDNIIRTDEPFDVDEFLRVSYEGRGKKWPQ